MWQSWLVRAEYLAGRTIRTLRRRREKYWHFRRNCQYYKDVVQLAKKYAPRARTVLDVGARDTPLVRKLDWIPDKTTLDLKARWIAGAKNIKMDFMNYHPPGRFDLVTCLQVVEHVKDPGAFVQKLLRTGRCVIISVPYQWPADSCPGHCHDPVDEAKLRQWSQCPWQESTIVQDYGRERLIAVFRGIIGAKVVVPPSQ